MKKLKETKMSAYSGIFDQSDARYELDYAYRVVADHTRMCSVCIADGMYPQIRYFGIQLSGSRKMDNLIHVMYSLIISRNSSNRLRKVLRRTLNICENVFKKENLMQHVILPEVVDILGTVYPELQKNCANIRETFDYESEHYKTTRTRNKKEFHSLNISRDSYLCEEDTIDFAGFPTGFRDVEKLLKSNKSIKSLPIDFMYDRLHVNLGLTDELIEKIASEKSLTVNMDEFAAHKQQKQFEAKMSRQHVNSSILNSIDVMNIPSTDYSFMYNYAFDVSKKEYVVDKIHAKVKMVKSNDNHHHIVLDRTNFYHNAGGQDADIGHMTDSNGTVFHVKAVEMHHGHVFHIGHFEKLGHEMFDENQEVELHVNRAHRTGLSQHHTAMHLLHAAIKHVTGQITFQQSSQVSCSDVKCEVGSIGKRIDNAHVSKIEELVRNVIHANVPIETRIFAAHDLYALDNVTIIPGEVYPDENIRVLMMKYKSKNFESIEPCCGTHAQNTGELDDFCITAFKFNTSTRSYNIRAIAGETVSLAKKNEQNIMAKLALFKEQINNQNAQNDWKSLEATALELLFELEKTQMPFTTKATILSEMEDLKKTIHLSQRANVRESIIKEMTSILKSRIENNDAFVIHVLNTDEGLEDSLISDAEQVCHDLPVILLNVSDNKIIHGRASVPIKYTTNRFNAKHWMEELGKSLNIGCQSNKKKKQLAVCTFSEIPDKRYSISDLRVALEKAKVAAQNAFNKLIAADQNDRSTQENDLLNRINVVKQKLENEDNVPKLVELEAETKQIRNHIKNNLFVYTTKKKCMADLLHLDEKIFEARSTFEKYVISFH